MSVAHFCLYFRIIVYTLSRVSLLLLFIVVAVILSLVLVRETYRHHGAKGSYLTLVRVADRIV